MSRERDEAAVKAVWPQAAGGWRSGYAVCSPIRYVVVDNTGYQGRPLSGRHKSPAAAWAAAARAVRRMTPDELRAAAAYRLVSAARPHLRVVMREGGWAARDGDEVLARAGDWGGCWLAAAVALGLQPA